MNTLFGDEVQLAKETSPGSIPFEGAIARVNALDWRQVGKDLDEQGKRPAAERPLRRRVQGGRVSQSGGVDLPQPRCHGTARLRTGRIQILQLSAPAYHSWSPHGALSSARSNRESLERINGNRGALSREPRRFCPALPWRRATATHPVALAVRPRRLQLPAPGSLRRARLSDPGGDPAFRARARFHRGRICAHRATAPYAIATGGSAITPRGCPGLRGPLPARTRHARNLSCESSAWR
jgi:hypothetical protein